MTNLLKETLAAVEGSGHFISEVHWVGTFDAEYAISWDEFEKISDVEYDSGFGAAEVASDLLVVFTDKTWLERREYDGSEYWEFNAPPSGSTPSGEVKTIKKVVSVYPPGGRYDDDVILWPSLQQLNP